MPVDTFEYRTEAERVAMQRAIAFIAQMNDLVLTAPPGQILDACELQALTAGRDLLRASLQQAVQARTDPCRARGIPASSEDYTQRDFARAVGAFGGRGGVR